MTLFLHAAGWLNAGRDSRERYDRHLKDVQQLLHNSGTYLLGTPEFVVRRFAEDGRLLVLENMRGRVEGCVAYELINVPAFDQTTGEVVQRRFCFLRHLALQPMKSRGEIVRHMVLEPCYRRSIRTWPMRNEKRSDPGRSCIAAVI